MLIVTLWLCLRVNLTSALLIVQWQTGCCAWSHKKTNMKLLYLSCHAILEYDELRLFEELGINYFSLGSYVNPRKPVDQIRPPLHHIPDEWLMNHAPDRDNIPESFIEKFDTIVVMHVPDWIENNWDKMKKKRVIWRTIGQSTPAIEKRLWKYRQEGLQVVRYHKREANIPENIGCDKIIHFYKDPNEFNRWMGPGNEVITIAQNMEHRGEFCNYKAFEYLASGFNAKVYGPNNQTSGELNGGFLTYDEMKQKYRDARAYIYTGTQPACYVLNLIEAMMTGVPVVAIGPKLATSLNIAGDVYAIPDIIHNGVNGFWSDDLDKLREHIQFLLKDKRAAERIGKMGRETAINLFGMENVKEDWRQFLSV